jgi:hypothetical protein
MSGHCRFCSRDFRSTHQREQSGVCSICYSLYAAIRSALKFIGKNSVDKILKAAENGESSLEG